MAGVPGLNVSHVARQKPSFRFTAIAPTAQVRRRRAAGRVTDVLVAALPDAQFSEVRAAGHLSPMTHAQVVNALIVETLQRFGQGLD